MKRICLLARIGEKAYDGMLDRPDLLPVLEKFYAGPYMEAKQIRDLCTEEVWANYKLLNLKGLKEQELLRQAFTKLRTIFYQLVPNAKAKDQAERIQDPTQRSSAELQGRQNLPSSGGHSE